MNGDIAVIGMGCLFPGARSPDEFWENLVHGRDCTSRATAADLGTDPENVLDPRRGQTDKTYCLRGGYVRNFQFDPRGYAVPPEMLASRDQSVQWTLYAAHEALRDSGHDGTSLGRCGAVVGNLSFPTRSSYRTYAGVYRRVAEAGLRAALASGDAEEEASFHLPVNQAIERGPDMPAAGIGVPDDLFVAGAPAMALAQAFGLGGPTCVLDAACASSLYAVDLACRYLLSGSADVMLAGAVSAADPLMITMGFSIFQAYPENGESRPLDQGSSGLISGEGAGMVVLKRYEDAVRDGDRVYARVRAVGLSNDGAGRHPLIPNSRGQEAAYARAYQHSPISPDSIQYIECHATGTPTGDIVELDSMESFFARPIPCGSVKSNFGHLLTAAGMASLIKVILAMQRRVIPPTIGVVNPLASTHGTAGGPTVVRTPTSWPSGTTPRRAAINAFGFGGTNAHLVLEEPEQEGGHAGGQVDQHQSPAMAITGMDICFGTAPDLGAYSAGIYQGTEVAPSDVPPSRWRGIDRCREALVPFGLNKAPPGGYLDSFDLDFMRARVQPDDAPIAQHLVLLKVADNAIRDADISPGGNVAVLVAMDTDLSLHQYRARVDLSWQLPQALESSGIELPADQRRELEELAKDGFSEPGQVNRYMSFIGNIMASRVSALWDFSGPALTISAGEQSVARALEVAKMLLEGGDVDAVVVGAVDLTGGLESVLRRNATVPFTMGPARLAFDAAATGPAVGEGAGAIVLQPHDGTELRRAYATIDAVAIAHPASRSEAAAHAVTAACGQALAQARVQAADIGYLDAHAGGLNGGEQQVADGILAAYASSGLGLTCALASAGLQVGDAQVAAAMAALIRAALCLDGRILPGTASWSGPARPGAWEGSPFYVPSEARPWLTADAVKRSAALTELASDRSAAHIILSESPRPAGPRRTDKPHLTVNPAVLHSFLVPVGGDSLREILHRIDALDASLRDGTSIRAVAQRQLDALRQGPPPAYTLSFVADASEELVREIERARSGWREAFESGGEWSTPGGSYFTAAPLGDAGVCFVYPGGFSSYLGQGRDLFHLVPDLHERLSARVPHLVEMLAERTIYPRSLQALPRHQLLEMERGLLQQPDVATASAGVLAIATTSILRDDFGVRPRFAFGYSLGEATMLWALGVWTDLKTAHERFRSWAGMPLDERARGWETYLLLASPDDVRATLDGKDEVYMTIVSTAGEVFIAGEPAACRRVIERLGCGHTRASFSQVLHCPPVHRAYDQLMDLYRYPVSTRPGLELYSASHYGPMRLEQDAIAESIARVICQPLDFPRLVARAYAGGARVFVEMGPGGTCARWIRAALRDLPHVTTAIDQKGLSSRAALLRSLAKLLSHGVSVDLDALKDSLEPEARESAAGGERKHTLNRRLQLGGSDAYRLLADRRGTFRRVSRPVPARAERQVARPAVSALFPLSSLTAHSSSVGETHRHLLEMRKDGLRSMAGLIRQGLDAWQMDGDVQPSHASAATLVNAEAVHTLAVPQDGGEHPGIGTVSSRSVIWDESQLREFAEGRIAPVFGPEYAVIDRYRRRVRLPTAPYLLVNRVTDLRTTGQGMRPATITTEYDVPPNAWYSSNGRLPVGIAIEAGQCDLLLISYLGIDFDNRGDRVYRLLDCTLTFMGDLPREGQTLRYEISIDSFAQSGDSLLFFFHYRCFLGDALLLKMDNGCAGFFTDQELEHGRGVIETEGERARRAAAQPESFTAPRTCHRQQFERADLEVLSNGDLVTCFGPQHAGPSSPLLRLPPPEFLMLDRITSVQPDGGAWGLGSIVAEKRLLPEDWYFPCHFKDDQVLAGSIVAEGCVQLLQFYLLYLGLHIHIEDAVFQPIRDLDQSVRCRGQIRPDHSLLTYYMEIVSIEASPLPSARANVDIVVDGKTVVRFTDLGIRIDGRPATPPDVPASPLFTEMDVAEFATGSIVSCFGPEYAVYSERRTPRIPNGDLQLISRIVDVEGRRGDLAHPSSLTAEYDVPNDVWFYRDMTGSIASPDASSELEPPYSVLMEMALQPCGFLSGWLGSTLQDPDTDFYFRNLDGRGELLREVDLAGRTVEARVRLRSSSRTADVIIQSFDYELLCAGRPFYHGDAVFGYFTAGALEQQTGLDGGTSVASWYSSHPEAWGKEVNLQADRRLFHAAPERPLYRLAGKHLDLLDRAIVVPTGGKYGKGYVEASRTVRPQDWFFDCHFFQDPVMPGSLGVEAMMEAIQIFALEQRLGDALTSPCFCLPSNHETVWKYRGQILRSNREMTLEVHILDVEVERSRVVLRADGSLWRDGLRIYEVRGLAVELRER